MSRKLQNVLNAPLGAVLPSAMIDAKLPDWKIQLVLELRAHAQGMATNTVYGDRYQLLLDSFTLADVFAITTPTYSLNSWIARVSTALAEREQAIKEAS